MELKSLLYSNGNNQKSAQTSHYMRENLYKAAFLRLVKTRGEARESLDKQRLICQCRRCPEMYKGLLISYISSQVFTVAQAHAYVYRTSNLRRACCSDLSLIQRGLGKKISAEGVLNLI